MKMEKIKSPFLIRIHSPAESVHSFETPSIVAAKRHSPNAHKIRRKIALVTIRHENVIERRKHTTHNETNRLEKSKIITKTNQLFTWPFVDPPSNYQFGHPFLRPLISSDSSHEPIPVDFHLIRAEIIFNWKTHSFEKYRQVYRKHCFRSRDSISTITTISVRVHWCPSQFEQAKAIGEIRVAEDDFELMLICYFRIILVRITQMS